MNSFKNKIGSEYIILHGHILAIRSNSKSFLKIVRKSWGLFINPRKINIKPEMEFFILHDTSIAGIRKKNMLFTDKFIFILTPKYSVTCNLSVHPWQCYIQYPQPIPARKLYKKIFEPVLSDILKRMPSAAKR